MLQVQENTFNEQEDAYYALSLKKRYYLTKQEFWDKDVFYGSIIDEEGSKLLQFTFNTVTNDLGGIIAINADINNKVKSMSKALDYIFDTWNVSNINLNCQGDYLVRFYNTFGFSVIDRQDFNIDLVNSSYHPTLHGEPDYYEMVKIRPLGGTRWES